MATVGGVSINTKPILSYDRDWISILVLRISDDMKLTVSIDHLFGCCSGI